MADKKGQLPPAPDKFQYHKGDIEWVIPPHAVPKEKQQAVRRAEVRKRLATQLAKKAKKK